MDLTSILLVLAAASSAAIAFWQATIAKDQYELTKTTNFDTHKTLNDVEKTITEVKTIVAETKQEITEQVSKAMENQNRQSEKMIETVMKNFDPAVKDNSEQNAAMMQMIPMMMRSNPEIFGELFRESMKKSQAEKTEES